MRKFWGLALLLVLVSLIGNAPYTRANQFSNGRAIGFPATHRDTEISAAANASQSANDDASNPDSDNCQNGICSIEDHSDQAQ